VLRLLDASSLEQVHTANGIRTRVTAVRALAAGVAADAHRGPFWPINALNAEDSPSQRSPVSPVPDRRLLRARGRYRVRPKVLSAQRDSFACLCPQTPIECRRSSRERR
jgi:hypothetical protein